MYFLWVNKRLNLITVGTTDPLSFNIYIERERGINLIYYNLYMYVHYVRCFIVITFIVKIRHVANSF